MAKNDRELLLNPARRRFLCASGGVVGGSWLALHLPALAGLAEAAAAARDAGAAFAHLSPLEAAGFDAIAARIIPTDATPGAREAGVVHFIDQALGDFMAEEGEELRAGLESLDAMATSTFHVERFAALEVAAQDELLRKIEETPFFGLMHYLTVAGMFALPDYGGNRDYLGWQLIGLSRQHAWLPPFGYYDAELMGVPLPEHETGGGHGHD